MPSAAEIALLVLSSADFFQQGLSYYHRDKRSDLHFQVQSPLVLYSGADEYLVRSPQFDPLGWKHMKVSNLYIALIFHF